ncbi:MAG: phage scaffolding protein [Firmicutes bacterium]|nr:phage scaffolding protein [Bacillota bacterium]
MEKGNNAEQAVTQPSETKPASQEGLTIPKHRFDCVNLCLKETKQALRDAAQKNDEREVRIIALEKTLLDAKIETALALHRARSLTAVKALIDFSNLKLGQDGSVSGLEEQILHIKKSQNYLFENQESPMYVLVPVKSGDSLNKSITNYIKKTEREQK